VTSRWDRMYGSAKFEYGQFVRQLDVESRQFSGNASDQFAIEDTPGSSSTKGVRNIFIQAVVLPGQAIARGNFQLRLVRAGNELTASELRAIDRLDPRCLRERNLPFAGQFPYLLQSRYKAISLPHGQKLALVYGVFDSFGVTSSSQLTVSITVSYAVGSARRG